MADYPKPSAKARRDERLQAALRQNLKRRKAQARGREESRERTAAAHDSAGIGPDKDSE